MLFVIAYFDPFERRDHSAEGPGGYHSGTMTTMTTDFNQSAVPGAAESTYEGKTPSVSIIASQNVQFARPDRTHRQNQY